MFSGLLFPQFIYCYHCLIVVITFIYKFHSLNVMTVIEQKLYFEICEFI